MFDIQQDRLGYSDLLQPASGYKLDFAVGMTYSLDLDAFLGVPVAMQEMGDMDSLITKSPFYVLEAIRKSNEKIAIFCNGGGMYLPANIHSVYSLLENSVFEVKLPDKQNFHPKLWVLLQSNDAGAQIIQFIVLSRNLTFDNSIDLVVSMTGKVGRAKRNKNRPVSDLLKFVASHCTNEIKKQKIQSLADALMYVREFEIQSAFEDYEFISLGINGVNGDNIDLFTSIRDAFVVSPFLSKDIVEKLSKGSGKKTLLTKKLPELKYGLDRFDEVYIVKDLLLDNEHHTKHDIHAKMYFTSGSKGNNLYIGSANCSHNAFYRNIEFLLKLKYAPNRGSYNIIANEFLGKEDKEKSPYELILELPEIEKDEKKEKDDWLSDKIRQVILCVERARIIKCEERFDIRIYSQELPGDVKIKIAPLQCPKKIAQLNRETLIDNLLLKELSELFILMVNDKKVVFKVLVENMPKERDDAIYKSIIDTKAKFIEYISFMISDNYMESYYQMQLYKDMIEESRSSKLRRPIYASLYEELLKLIVGNPDKLKDIEDIIRHLDKDVIPQEFNKVYDEFKKVLKML